MVRHSRWLLIYDHCIKTQDYACGFHCLHNHNGCHSDTGLQGPAGAAGIHKIADIVCDLMIAGVGSSYLFNRQPSNRPETPEESAQRRRRRILAGAVFLTVGLVMLAKDIAKLL